MFYVKDAHTHTEYGDAGGGALSTLAGYDETALGDGTVEKGWRSGASSTLHQIAIDLTDPNWDTVGVFDVVATDGTAPSLVQIDMGSNLSTWHGAEEPITLNGDGDGWLSPTEAPSRYVNILVSFASAKYLRIGEILAGKKVTLSRGYTDRTDTHDWHVLENVTRAGTRHAVRTAGRSRVLSLRWDLLLSAERTEFLTLWDDLAGGATPTFIVPNADAPTDVLHGTIPPTWSEEVDFIYSGIAFDFVQSGRAA